MKEGEVCIRHGTECRDHNLLCGYPQCLVKPEPVPEFKYGQLLLTNDGELVKYEFEAPSHPRIVDGPVVIVRRADPSDEQFTISKASVRALTYHSAICRAIARYAAMIRNDAKIAPTTEFAAFIERAGQEAGEGKIPLPKLCRWLGYIQGVVIQQGFTTVEAERDWTRPLFRPFDCPEEV